MVTALWGAFLISTIVLCVKDTFKLSHDQEVALTQVRLSKKAARVIQASLKYFMAKKKQVK